jgi:hypothetical protein
MKDPTRRYPELSLRGEKILMALLEHPIYEKAAAAAGVSLATLWRWRQKPEFQKALLEARRDVHSQAMARLQQGAAAAASTVLRVMVDPATPATAKLRASQMVLDNAARGIEFQDLEVRFRDLERAPGPTVPGKSVPEIRMKWNERGWAQSVARSEIEEETDDQLRTRITDGLARIAAARRAAELPEKPA